VSTAALYNKEAPLPTPFLSTMFVVMTTLNGAGQLAPVDPKVVQPPEPYKGYIFWSVDQCMYVRGKMDHPAKYVCQVFRGPKEIDWEFKPGATTPDHAEGSPIADPPREAMPGDSGREGRLTPIAPSGSSAPADPAKYHEYYRRERNSFVDVAVGPSELRPEDAPVIEPRAIQPKRIAQKRQHQQQFDPIGATVSLFTPRADW
jgi:hypothetical protein